MVNLRCTSLSKLMKLLLEYLFSSLLNALANFDEWFGSAMENKQSNNVKYKFN